MDEHATPSVAFSERQLTEVSNNARVWRWLRIVISQFALVLCVSFGVLWAGSYSHQGVLNSRIKKTYGFYMSSWEGIIRSGCIDIIKEPFGSQFTRSTILRLHFKKPVNPIKTKMKGQFSHLPNMFGFHVTHLNNGWAMSVPHWFLVLLTGATAITFKPKPRLKFSLREIMLLTTITAGVVGAVTILFRSLN
ncbi:MAG: hypothetical protein KDA57_02275 [Planctomycetales bacterium]|nr:hypothetical protein [Planctomycetales bacterium]